MLIPPAAHFYTIKEAVRRKCRSECPVFNFCIIYKLLDVALSLAMSLGYFRINYIDNSITTGRTEEF